MTPEHWQIVNDTVSVLNRVKRLEDASLIIKLYFGGEDYYLNKAETQQLERIAKQMEER